LQIVIIGEKETVTTFATLGVRGVIVNSADEMYKELLENAKKEDIGLILLSEAFSRKIRDKINNFRLKNPIPVILEVPSRLTKEKVYFDYKDIIKKSMGVKI